MKHDVKLKVKWAENPINLVAVEIILIICYSALFILSTKHQAPSAERRNVFLQEDNVKKSLKAFNGNERWLGWKDGEMENYGI